MISYNNKEIVFDGCPGCAYGSHEFHLDCGMAYENERFTFHIIYNIGIIFDYAKKNFRNDENYEKIKSITEIVKNSFNEYYRIYKE